MNATTQTNWNTMKSAIQIIIILSSLSGIACEEMNTDTDTDTTEVFEMYLNEESTESNEELTFDIYENDGSTWEIFEGLFSDEYWKENILNHAGETLLFTENHSDFGGMGIEAVEQCPELLNTDTQFCVVLY